MRAASRFMAVLSLVVAVFSLTGCDRLFERGAKEDVAAADKKLAAGDVRGAVAKYEAALDGTADTADVHYKLAVIYDEKLRSPLSALHHMERYLVLAPSGTHAKEAKSYKKEGETKLATLLNKGAPATQDEVIRLKNDNEALRKRLVEVRAQKALPAATRDAKGDPVQKAIPSGSRTYVVVSGDTLAKISRKFYKTSTRAKDIQDANFNALEGTVTIKPGMRLIIP